jgi:hypothetical protein
MPTTSEKFGTSFSGTGWSNPSNAGSSNNLYTNSPAADSGVTISAFDATDANFSEVGDSDSVTQLVVRIEAKYNSRASFLNSIQLLQGGSLSGSTQGPSANLSTTDAILTYTFSVSWTGAQLKAAGTGARLVFKRDIGKGFGNVSVDGVTFQATYSGSTTTTTAATTTTTVATTTTTAATTTTTAASTTTTQAATTTTARQSSGPRTILGSRRIGHHGGLSGN